MGGYDPIMLHTCIKYHNESQYFIQLIYTNILDVGYCFIIGSIQELEKAKKKTSYCSQWKHNFNLSVLFSEMEPMPRVPGPLWIISHLGECAPGPEVESSYLTKHAG